MKIIINALSARQGGGQTYIKHLLENFPKNGNSEAVVVVPKSLKLQIDTFNIKKLNTLEIVGSNPIARMLWEILILPKIIRNTGADVLFCPGGSINGNIPKNCKIVTTFQNMLPFDQAQSKKYPFGYARFRNWYLHKKLLKSMVKSDLVIFISKYAKSIIENDYGLKLKNSVVIPHGISPIFKRNVELELLRPSWLPNSEYLLYVSIFDVYKAQLEVIKAYDLFKKCEKTDLKLVLIGSDHGLYGQRARKLIKELKLERDVLVAGEVLHNELPAIYQNALINIFASETENCPFILLEALASGRPILASNCQPMPEFGGDAVLYFSPQSPNELSRLIAKVSSSKVLINKLSQKSLERSSLYNWENSATRTWRSIKQLIDK